MYYTVEVEFNEGRKYCYRYHPHNEQAAHEVYEGFRADWIRGGATRMLGDSLPILSVAGVTLRDPDGSIIRATLNKRTA